MNFPALLQAGARELLPQLQAARRQLSDGEGGFPGSTAASPSKVCAAWRHACGAGKLFSCHQLFLAPCRARLGLTEHQ